MITEINTGIPTDTNRRIVNNLFTAGSWRYGKDNTEPNINKNDTGFLMVTYMLENQGYFLDNVLNAYAYMILDIVNQKSIIKIKQVKRIFWNWYNPSSQCTFHKDSDDAKNYSIVYSMFDNDGGTEFKINDKNKFYQSFESKALLFPSIIEHRGKASVKKPNRFNLNIMGEI